MTGIGSDSSYKPSSNVGPTSGGIIPGEIVNNITEVSKSALSLVSSVSRTLWSVDIFVPTAYVWYSQ